MGVGLMERARIQRQPAHLLLAAEFGSATLNEKGFGEFDPSFVITKLGAKINRLVAAGLLERMELRDTSSGASMYQGQIPKNNSTFTYANSTICSYLTPQCYVIFYDNTASYTCL